MSAPSARTVTAVLQHDTTTSPRVHCHDSGFFSVTRTLATWSVKQSWLSLGTEGQPVIRETLHQMLDAVRLEPRNAGSIVERRERGCAVGGRSLMKLPAWSFLFVFWQLRVLLFQSPDLTSEGLRAIVHCDAQREDRGKIAVWSGQTEYRPSALLRPALSSALGVPSSSGSCLSEHGEVAAKLEVS